MVLTNDYNLKERISPFLEHYTKLITKLCVSFQASYNSTWVHNNYLYLLLMIKVIEFLKY